MTTQNSTALRYADVLRALVERDDFLLCLTRRERLLLHPFRTIYYAAVRRLLYKLYYSMHILDPHTTAKTFFGESMHCYFPLSFELRKWGILNDEDMLLSHFILTHLKEGGVFIDGGAHVGYFSLMASKIVGEEGSVHAFEPTPRVFAILKENLGSKPNVHLNNAALWETKGLVRFEDFDSIADVGNCVVESSVHDGEFLRQNARNISTIEVPSVDLDSYCAGKNVAPTLVKLDVEGGEYRVLLGAKNVLSRHPIVVGEVHGHDLGNGSAGKMIRFLGGYGYAPFLIDKSFRLVPFDYRSGVKGDMANVVFKV